MSKNNFLDHVAKVSAWCLCGMISLHGGLTLLYLSMTSVGFSTEEILVIYLAGCLVVVLIPLMGLSCERTVLGALFAKMLLAFYATVSGAILPAPEALCSGLIASSSFYFAMREIAQAENGKLLASVLILIINIESLLWYSTLGWLSQHLSLACVAAAYGVSIALILLYIQRFVSTAVVQRGSLRKLMMIAKGLSVFNLASYMLAVFAVNCFNLSINRWAGLNSGYVWGSVLGITLLYILGVMTSVCLLACLRLNGRTWLTIGILGLSLLSYWLAENANQMSGFMGVSVSLLGALSTMVMSSIVADLARTQDLHSRLVVVAMLAAMQVCLISVIRLVNVFPDGTLNEWLAIALASSCLILLMAYRRCFPGRLSSCSKS